MIKVENVCTWGLEHAIRGMRNPYDSWDRSDSEDGHLGDRDLTLMRQLYKAGPEHRKYLRQIFVSMDITAPFYWWKEFDKYQIGVTTNSCSTMHTIHKKEFTLDSFSHDFLTETSIEALQSLIDVLNKYRNYYLTTKSKKDWWQLIQLLPSSYNQKRTVTMNYENAVSMIRQRTGHKLEEWNNFIKELKNLPYLKDIMEATCED